MSVSRRSSILRYETRDGQMRAVLGRRVKGGICLTVLGRRPLSLRLSLRGAGALVSLIQKLA